MSDIEIEIDGKKLKAKPNSMIIQVADEAGIYIPRFCYHKHLSVAANCRMCLVEVEKSPKILPACATPVMPGMKVFTRTKKALEAQKAVMEFLLINHPLDCPICDQGGECELQDLSMGYGSPDSYYNQGKRAVHDQDIGPLIATHMTRCIHCTRCVRFGQEIAGMSELGVTNRGEHAEIGTYVKHAMKSEVSGNVIDLCPVGALTSKPFEFRARAWELEQYPSIAPHDCLGSNVNIHVRTGKVMRIVPRENNTINETWISDRDRFGYEGLYHPDRIAKPKIKIDNAWHETDWQSAIETAMAGLQKAMNAHGVQSIGALASPNSTTEEFYLLQKLMRKLGSDNIDHRLRQSDFSDQVNMPLYPGMSKSLQDIENSDLILLIGSNIQKEQPIAGLRVRKAIKNGAKVIALNMIDYNFNFAVDDKKIVAPHEFVESIAAIAKAVANHKNLSDIEVNPKDQAIVDKIIDAKNISIILGAHAQHHTNAAVLRSLANTIAEYKNTSFEILTDGANSAGGFIAGAIPNRQAQGFESRTNGLNAKSMLESSSVKAFILLNVEPTLDCVNSRLAHKALENADFIVSCSLYNDPLVEHLADVILPIVPFTETSGTFINVNGQMQSFSGVSKPFGQARPAWKVLRVLANFLQLDGFDFESSEEVLAELNSIKAPELTANFALDTTLKIVKDTNMLSRIGEIPIYSGDSLVRRADSLQEAQPILEGDVDAARMHPETADKFLIKDKNTIWVKQENEKIELELALDTKIPLNAIYIAGGIHKTSMLGDLFGLVEVIQ